MKQISARKLLLDHQVTISLLTALQSFFLTVSFVVYNFWRVCPTRWNAERR